MADSFVDTVVTYINAGYPLLVINTPEEIRATIELRRVGWMFAHGRKLNIGNTFDIAKLKKYFQSVDPEYRFEINGSNITIDAYKGFQLQELLAANAADVNARDFLKEIEAILGSVGYPCISWDGIRGFDDAPGQDESEQDLMNALNLVAKIPQTATPEAIKAGRFWKHGIFIFRDIHHFINNEPIIRRLLRNIVEENQCFEPSLNVRRPIILIQSDWQPHSDIKHLATMVDFELPNSEQLDREITFAAQGLTNRERAECPGELRIEIRRAIRGFTQTEALNTLAFGLARHNGFHPDIVKTIHRLKAATFRNDEILTYIDEDAIAGVDEIGGYDNYMEFIEQCKICYSDEAMKQGVRLPKGVLLIGVPGSGKSMVAQVTAKRMHLPLIMYNFSAVFGGIVGETETNQRRALRRVKAQGECVLMIDEADKAFGGIVGSTGDSGVGQRVFGQLLSWMANENDAAFVVMTMNRTIGVPPEMLRSGRLDAIFYATFPRPDERLRILQIHMIKNHVPTANYSAKQWEELVRMTDQYVGAEIEQLIINATRVALVNRKNIVPMFDEIKQAAENISPVATLDVENIRAIEDFCKGRATPVSKPPSKGKAAATPKRSIITGDTRMN